MLLLGVVPVYPKMSEDYQDLPEGFSKVSEYTSVPTGSHLLPLSFCILCISFADCGSANATSTPPLAAMNGSSGGEGAFCVPNGDKAIEYLGFNAVSGHMHRPKILDFA